MEKYYQVVSMLGYRFSKAPEDGKVSCIMAESPPHRTYGGSREVASQPVPED
jgi:hypothetical protein